MRWIDWILDFEYLETHTGTQNIWSVFQEPTEFLEVIIILSRTKRDWRWADLSKTVISAKYWHRYQKPAKRSTLALSWMYSFSFSSSHITIEWDLGNLGWEISYLRVRPKVGEIPSLTLLKCNKMDAKMYVLQYLLLETSAWRMAEWLTWACKAETRDEGHSQAPLWSHLPPATSSRSLSSDYADAISPPQTTA